MLIPALAPASRGLDGDGGETDGGAALGVGPAVVFVGEVLIIEDAAGDANDEEEVVEVAVEEILVEEDDTLTVVAESLPCEPIAEGPHVCGEAALFDVIRKGGVFSESSSAEFSSCM